MLPPPNLCGYQRGVRQELSFTEHTEHKATEYYPREWRQFQETFTLSRKRPDGLKVTTLLLLSIRSSPVCGLRPILEFLSRT